MKKWYIYFLLVAIFFSGSGCSDDLYLSDNELYTGDGVCEVWTGDGIPTWLQDRQCKFEMDAGWLIKSEGFDVLWRAYKFEYKSTLMLALEYEKVGYVDSWEEGTICYAADGRAVNFSKVRDSFKKGAELIWTNEFCLEGSEPQVSDCGFENPESFGWFQEAIDTTCREVREAGNFMLGIYLLESYDEEGNSYLSIRYIYADRTGKKCIEVENYYNAISGERVNDVSEIKFDYNKNELLWNKHLGLWYMGE